MVYSGDVLARSDRRLITDAFVVVDKEAYLKLDGTVPAGLSPVLPNYTLTEADHKLVETFTSMIELIYQKYDKATYKTQLISLFRKLINS
jgi:hypothetical protein